MNSRYVRFITSRAASVRFHRFEIQYLDDKSMLPWNACLWRVRQNQYQLDINPYSIALRIMNREASAIGEPLDRSLWRDETRATQQSSANRETQESSIRRSYKTSQAASWVPGVVRARGAHGFEWLIDWAGICLSSFRNDILSQLKFWAFRWVFPENDDQRSAQRRLRSDLSKVVGFGFRFRRATTSGLEMCPDSQRISTKRYRHAPLINASYLQRKR